MNYKSNTIHSLLNECDGKADVRVYDYIGIHEPMCDNMYHKRLNGYASIGYTTITKNAPTLFDDLEDVDFSTNDGQIFNGKTYYRVFTKDLAAAKHSIVISSPKLYALQRSNVVSMLKELSVSGLDIIILTRLDDDQSDYLISQGLSVRIDPSLSLCCTIIDKQQVWYGSVNALGYANEEDSVIKLSDSSLGNELINELFKK